jgi:hypothetical protein
VLVQQQVEGTLVTLEPFGGMQRFSITPDFDAACAIKSESIAVEVYHVRRNQSGGAILIPVARFFASRPVYTDNYHAHWRVDCFVRAHELSPQPKVLGLALAEGLLRESICTEPLWVS